MLEVSTVPASPFDVIHPNDPELREKILGLEKFLMELPDHLKVELPERDHFAPGVYARELPIPSGTLIVGKIHKYQNMNILASGDISVLTDNGIQRIVAPAVIVSPPGTKRVGYAHSDSVWITIHGTHETDVAKIEAEVLVKSFDELPALAVVTQTLEG